jgi:hypothetical protein
MPTRRVLKSVLTGFLGTYSSRYSEFHGYWLFGFIIKSLDRMEVDLLVPGDSDHGHPARLVARQLAAQRFYDQVTNHGLHLSMIRSAQLILERRPDDGSLPGQHSRGGYNLHFVASVTADNGKSFERRTAVFVAPHDPKFENAVAFPR